MAAIVKVMNNRALTKSKILPTFQLVRNHWNRDWKPNKFPETQKEREAAAAKYGIPIEKYEPYPDDGLGRGDYPKLPDISVESKDPYYAYDFPEYRRNFQEPVHAHIDMIGEDRINISLRRRNSPLLQISTFLGVVGGCFLLYHLIDDYKIPKPVLEKQLPRPGVVNYTFEPKSQLCTEE